MLNCFFKNYYIIAFSYNRCFNDSILVFSTIAGFVGTPSGVTAPPLNDTNYIVTNLTCNSTFECTNTTGSTGCSSYGGGYATITCGRCMSPTTCVYLSVSLIPSIFSFIH